MTTIPAPPVAVIAAPSGLARLLQLVPWFVVAGLPLVLPGYEPLAMQVFVMILFALSLDLLVGYAGIVTLGHAGLFGMGAYTAGILSVHGVTDPIVTALAAMVVAALTGLVFGAAMLRTKGLTLLMLTMAAAFLLYEIANKATGLTGGEDGLQGVSFTPVLGLFAFDFRGKTAFFYSLVALFLVFTFVRILINSPFGWSLRGIRENDARMVAIGCPILQRRVVAYVISAALAGLAGALQAQTTQFVALHSLSFELSGNILIMLILGGSGRLYGAFVGVPAFMFAQDLLAKQDPANWFLGQGIILIAMVMLAPGGMLGIAERAMAAIKRRLS
ncbi:MAG: branched-chain amino acid ABC transporter permease [Xanthobacteraceae bacterium]|nr:MAG: branched-chain amino acid ABC transporter permease [Xanthobacteraceae bacterium]